MDIDEEFPFTTEEQAITEKDWAAGSREPKEFIECIVNQNKSASFQKITYAPQMAKMFDEPIVNCLDHAVKNQESGNPARSILITIDDTGRVIIQNDGDGIPALVHKKASATKGKEVYLPTLIFAYLFQGSNREDNKPVGGTNGIGAKITNCLSTEFQLDTVRDGKLFSQKWEQMKSIEHDPKITSTKVKPYTRLTFMPNYSHFGYTDETLITAMPDITSLLCSRVAMAAMFCRYCLPNVNVKFNGAQVSYTSNSLASAIYPDAQLIRFTTDAPNTWQEKLTKQKFPWDVSIVITPHKYHHLTNLNGIVVREGPHINKIIKQISTTLKERIGKSLNNNTYKLPPNFVKNNVFIVMNAQMIKPGWTGQRKDVLDVTPDKLKDLVIPDKALAQICKALTDLAIADKEPTKTPKRSEKIDYEKYEPAKKHGRKSALFACEGDSAMGQIMRGLSSSIGFDFHGIISLGGVIVNTMKEITEIKSGDNIIIKKTGKFEKSPFMTAFVKIVGLNYDYKYDKESPTYEKEMNSLRYGNGIIMAVDQDLDGRGNIMPILLALFKVFWPKLLEQGFVRWFCSDIIRLYPNTKKSTKVLSFWSEYAFKQASHQIDLTHYDLQYFKGWASNTTDETKIMFRNFNERIRTFTTDDETNNLFEIFYGKESELRKQKLSIPPRLIADEIIAKQDISGIISVSHHLETESRAFQGNNLEQKLDHFIDGQNQAGRKILNGALIYFRKNNNSKVRVSQLGGAIGESQLYHHGEASMNGSIKKRAFIACGGVQVPFFVPKGAFGSRLEGGNDAGSERYVYTQLTDICSILFNWEDYELLDFHFEDNKRIEPKYFIPLIPLAILESKELPAHGWKLSLWARDVFTVIAAIKRAIIGEKVGILPPARYDNAPYRWTGTFTNICGKPHSLGTYERYVIGGGKHLIRITELPLRTWTKQYMSTLTKLQEKYDFIEKVESDNNVDKVGIDITLSKDGLDRIAGCGNGIWTDDIEEFFQLRSSMTSHINLIGKSGEVIEFKSYEEVFNKWFPEKRELYAKRFERRLAILSIDIKIEEEVIRYIKANYAMRGMKRAEMDAFLDTEAYTKVVGEYKSKIKFQPTSAIPGIVYGHGASYVHLLGLSDLKKTAEKIKKREDELSSLIETKNKIEAEIATDPFVGASEWMRELDALEQGLRDGFRVEWDADKERYTY
jgi:DNA topoisomerase-2